MWSARVHAHVSDASRFPAALAELGARQEPLAWVHASTPDLIGLERWGASLCAIDRRAGVAALVAAAEHGFPKIVARAAGALESMGFLASEQVADGAPVETQIARAAAWVRAPGPATSSDVHAAYDPTRQLNVWDPDLYPAPDDAWQWYYEVGQCLCAAVTRDDGTEAPPDGSYDLWPARACVGRGLVIAARGLFCGGARDADVLSELGAAIVGAFV